METEFEPIASLVGGALIGLSAGLLMALHGKIAGMTAIVAGVLPPVSSDWGWRAAFLAGAMLAPAAIVAFRGSAPPRRLQPDFKERIRPCPPHSPSRSTWR
jgi:MFS family permease